MAKQFKFEPPLPNDPANGLTFEELHRLSLSDPACREPSSEELADIQNRVAQEAGRPVGVTRKRRRSNKGPDPVRREHCVRFGVGHSPSPAGFVDE